MVNIFSRKLEKKSEIKKWRKFCKTFDQDLKTKKREREER